VERGLFFPYLASNPVWRFDNTRHKDRTSGDNLVRRPSVPAPDAAGSKCHNLHFYTAAQHDPKISGIKLSRGPHATWNTARDTTEALHQFLVTLTPLTRLVGTIFRVVAPEIWDIYDRVYRALPANKITKPLKEVFGIWTSRSIVLNTETNIHVLKDACHGFCAIVPFGNFKGGNVCLPTLGISVPLVAGMFYFYF